MPVTRSVTRSMGDRVIHVEAPTTSTSTEMPVTSEDTRTSEHASRAPSTLVPTKPDEPRRAGSVRSAKSTTKRQEFELRMELAQLERQEAQAAAAMTRAKLELLQFEEYEDSVSDDPRDRDQGVHIWVEQTMRENPPANLMDDPQGRFPEQLTEKFPEQKLSVKMEEKLPPEKKQANETEGIKDLANAIIFAVNRRGATSTPPKYMHELPYFDGHSNEWLAFKVVYEDTAPMFSGIQNMARLRICLKGAAREAVKSLLYSEASPEEVMDGLRRRFGRPDALVLAEMEKLRILPRLSDNPRDVCVFASQVNNCVATIKGLKKPQYLHSPEMTRQIVEKLPAIMRYRWFDYAAERNDKEEPSLVNIAKYLNREADRCGEFALPEYLEIRENRRPQRQAVHAAVVNNENSGKTNSNEDRDNSCAHCQGNHKLLECRKFLQVSTQDRWDIAKKARTCFQCLSSGHRRENCRQPPCKICRRQHHSLLHEEWPAEKEDTSRPETSEKPTHAVSNVVHALKNTGAYLKMVPVEVFGPKGTARVLALLDEGSTVSLLDSEVAKKIGAKGLVESLELETVGGKRLLNNRSMILDLEIQGIHQDRKKRIKGVRTIENINLASQGVNEKGLQACKHLQKIAKQLMYEREKPKLLIGQDNWELIVSRYTRKGKANQPVASYTSMGWVLHGCDGRTAREMRVQCCAHLAPAEDNLEAIVKENLFRESLCVTPRQSSTDAESEALAIEERTMRLPKSRCKSGLTWKSRDETVPEPTQEKKVNVMTTSRKECDTALPDFTGFSSWKRFLQATVLLLLFVNVCRSFTQGIRKNATWAGNWKTLKTKSKAKKAQRQSTRNRLLIKDVYLQRAGKMIERKKEDNFMAETKAIGRDFPTERSGRLHKLDVCKEDELLQLRGRACTVSGIKADLAKPEKSPTKYLPPERLRHDTYPSTCAAANYLGQCE